MTTPIRSLRSLLADDMTYNQVRALVAAGQLQRLRRDAYALTPEPTDVDIIRAGWTLLHEGSVLSHLSAAVLWGLPLWRTQPDRVWITRNGAGNGHRRQWLHTRRCPLPADEVVTIDGMQVTSLARTATDVSRLLGMDAAVCLMDAALRRGSSRDEPAEVVERSVHRPGVWCARTAAAFANPLAESPGESVSRLRMHQAHVPPPVLQFEVTDRFGHLLGFYDFGWRDERLLGECDGSVKYDQLVSVGSSPGQVFMKEKRRERDALEEDWRCLRWGIKELDSPRAFGDMVWRWLRRAA